MVPAIDRRLAIPKWSYMISLYRENPLRYAIISLYKTYQLDEFSMLPNLTELYRQADLLDERLTKVGDYL